MATLDIAPVGEKSRHELNTTLDIASVAEKEQARTEHNT